MLTLKVEDRVEAKLVTALCREYGVHSPIFKYIKKLEKTLSLKYKRIVDD